MSDRPIRLMNIITRLNVSGPAIHAALLTERFSAPDYDSMLVCGTPDADEGDMTYYAAAHGVKPVVVPELSRSVELKRDFAAYRTIEGLMRDFQPDIVHTHTSKAGFLGRYAAHRLSVPVIVHTFHGHVFSGAFPPALAQLFILLERRAAAMSDTIITLSEGLRSELAEDYHIARRKHFTVLPLGLDLDGYATTPRRSGICRAAWEIPPEAPLVGIVGRVVAVKNHALFLDAAAKVRQQLPGTHFVVVGDGELRAEMEARAAALGLRDAIRFTGWQRELAPVYSDLDVLVISSQSEGTPGSVIESLAAGCPVVATAVGGVPDLLDHGRLGLLVAPGDAEALAAGILHVLRQPPDVAEAQRSMLDRYSIGRLARDMDSLYRGLLAKKRRDR